MTGPYERRVLDEATRTKPCVGSGLYAPFYKAGEDVSRCGDCKQQVALEDARMVPHEVSVPVALVPGMSTIDVARMADRLVPDAGEPEVHAAINALHWVLFGEVRGTMKDYVEYEVKQ